MRYCRTCLSFTPWQVGTARGRHFVVLAHPGVPVANRATDVPSPMGPLPIHVRADGGYVLAPGSVHPDGPVYRPSVYWSAPRVALRGITDPAWFPGPAPAPPVSERPTPALAGPEFLLHRARRYLAAIPLPEIGHGSDQAVFSAACRLCRGFALPRATRNRCCGSGAATARAGPASGLPTKLRTSTTVAKRLEGCDDVLRRLAAAGRR